MSGEWKYGVLNDAVTKGSSNISLRKIKEEEGTYPVYGAKGFIKNVSFYQQEQEYLALIKDGAGIGRVSKHPARSSILATMQYIIPKEGFHIDFIKYFLKSLDFETYRTGSTIPHIYFKNYKNAKFPLVQLTEQQKIVTLLDEAFAQIQQAQANIEQNIVNAKELFQSKLNEIFSQRGEGWEEKSLGEVCEIRPKKKLAKNKLKDDELVSFIPMKYLPVNQIYFSSDETKTLKKAYSGYVYFENDDVILAKITPCFENGKLGIAKNLTNGIGFGSSEYIPYRTNKNVLIPEFLYFFLNRDVFRIKGKSLMSGAVGHKRIQPEFYENEVIVLPDLNIQKEICNEIISLQKELENLKKLYQQKLDNLEELKKSLLEKAFSGALTRDSITAS